MKAVIALLVVLLPMAAACFYLLNKWKAEQKQKQKIERDYTDLASAFIKNTETFIDMHDDLIRTRLALTKKQSQLSKLLCPHENHIWDKDEQRKVYICRRCGRERKAEDAAD